MCDKKKILLIVTGGIAAYKSLELVRLLTQDDFFVTTVMTESSQNFLTPLSLSVLSGNKTHVGFYDKDAEMEFGHIELSRNCDLVVVAPTTANFLGKTANGIADDLASNIMLATDKPVLMVPAMNVRMWSHPATQRNVGQLRRDGIQFVGPHEGVMACGEFGYGRMTEPPEIIEAIKMKLGMSKITPLTGKRVLVTSGPTVEQIDPIRYISNKSSGIQGAAIASALRKVGAKVFFITGPADQEMPTGVEIVKAQTASDMLESAKRHGPYDVAICVAAVCDWRIKNIAPNKLKKDKSINTIELEFIKTPDILEHLSNAKDRPDLVIGFAAETEKLEDNALKKLKSKNCDWILANNVDSKNGVMGQRDTQITLFSTKGKKVFPKMSKAHFADLLIKQICSEFK